MDLEFKGTPGEWKVREGNGLLFVESSKEQLKTPYGQEIMADDYFNEDWKFHDAKLIAAAPDLLEALKEMLSRFENCDIGFAKADYVRGLAIKAIEKALK